MRFLLDTHLLVELALTPEKLSARTRALLLEEGNSPCFSVVSLWEIAVKNSLKRSNVRLDVAALREGLLAERFTELALTGGHILQVTALPGLHQDPFDRLLLCQALAESMPLYTGDEALLQYPRGTKRA